MRRKWIWIVVAILVFVFVGGGILFSQMGKGMADLLTRTIAPIDLTEVPDGTYRGEFSASPISVVLEVTVMGGVLTDVEIIRHVNGQGEAGEGVIPEVLDAQSLNVDAIAGATYSSKCILFAIEDALVNQNPAE